MHVESHNPEWCALRTLLEQGVRPDHLQWVLPTWTISVTPWRWFLKMWQHFSQRTPHMLFLIPQKGLDFWLVIFPEESTQKLWCYLWIEKQKDLAFCFQLDNLPGHQYPLKHLKQFIYSLCSLKRKQPLKAELHSIITLILCIWHSEEPKLNTTEHLKCIHGAMKVELTPN